MSSSSKFSQKSMLCTVCSSFVDLGPELAVCLPAGVSDGERMCSSEQLVKERFPAT